MKHAETCQQTCSPGWISISRKTVPHPREEPSVLRIKERDENLECYPLQTACRRHFVLFFHAEGLRRMPALRGKAIKCMESARMMAPSLIVVERSEVACYPVSWRRGQNFQETCLSLLANCSIMDARTLCNGICTVTKAHCSLTGGMGLRAPAAVLRGRAPL